jgi:LacI family transcriptional regulator
MATIKDVARQSGVSVASVSRVINNGPKVSEATRERVNKVIKDLGYTPNANARALVKRKTMAIGVVIPELIDPFFASLAHNVDEIARQHNMQLLVSTAPHSAESERAAIKLLVAQRCEVIIFHSKFLDDQELVALCKQIRALVLIDRLVEAVSERCVWLDNEEGGKIAARHLLSLKHQNIACVSSIFQIEDPLQRLQGFKNELSKSNLHVDEDLIKYDEPNQQGGEKAAHYLLASGKPFSAVFVYNDAMAVGVIAALESNGFLVPDDIAVIGFDNSLMSMYCKPKLSTLHYPIDEMAQKATKLALSLKESNQPVLSLDAVGKLEHQAVAKPDMNEQKQALTHKYFPYLVKRAST